MGNMFFSLKTTIISGNTLIVPPSTPEHWLFLQRCENSVIKDHIVPLQIAHKTWKYSLVIYRGHVISNDWYIPWLENEIL